ncbi:peptide deformylase [Arthrobacter stackebrandtii]|uniref:Peptide deformylase n=1 Tax=Arthrobacter stackebrandtii TaxID=272161 RepID=A0ABS4Z0X0_9MICC|nr:peptide deformylase [Arthrobacter stackebrandtii]MBP2414651.1 peptide deformylase [Arthrobacter stackebrandtii]PYH01745.1 peptide deformylase [Arthrobacter stackebrandtii]
MTEPSSFGHAIDAAYLRAAVDAVLSPCEPGSGRLPAIVQAGHPVLRARALPFTGQLTPDELARLIEIMTDTMRAAPGVGLAAPQIGIPLQLAVLEDTFEVSAENAAARAREPLELFTIINPSYTPLGTEPASHYEGCLSMSGWQAVVDRASSVELKYDDEHGTAQTATFSGWQARIVQHETDHLFGTLYIDKAHTRSLCANAEYARYWANPDIAAAKAGLNF